MLSKEEIVEELRKIAGKIQALNEQDHNYKVRLAEYLKEYCIFAYENGYLLSPCRSRKHDFPEYIKKIGD